MFIPAAHMRDGCRILRASKPDEAPFHITFETPPDAPYEAASSARSGILRTDEQSDGDCKHSGGN